MKIGQEISDLVTIAQYRALYINTAVRLYIYIYVYIQGVSNMTGTICV